MRNTKTKGILSAILLMIAMSVVASAVPPELTNVSPPGDTVTSYAGISQNFSVQVNETQIVDVYWSIDNVSVLTELSVPISSYENSSAASGTYSVCALVVNAGDPPDGNPDWSVTRCWSWTVLSDTTAPSVVSNTNNVRVRNGTTVTLNASITDAGSGVKNATVNVSKMNSTRNTVALTNQSGFWVATVIADKATTGYENLNIVAYDNAGNVNNSVGMTVWVDGVAPGNVTNLTNITYAQTHINSTWDDPVDADLDHVEVYANDTFKQNVSKGTKFYNLTGLSANTQYNISVRPIDSVGNPGNWTNYSATTAPESPTDTTAPTVTISSPENKTYTTTSVPLTVSANEAIGEWRYRLNGAANVTFFPNTTITAAEGANNITVYANDSANNWNSSTMNFTVTTPPAPSSSSGGSSGSGGGGVVSSEPAANIEKYTRVDGSLIANTPVTFSINLPEIPVSEFVVTGKENQNDVTFRVDALRGMAKDVTIPPRGVPYKHLIISENSKRIKEAVIRFKVENSWLTANGIVEVSMLHWDGNTWKPLETVEKNKDDAFIYFEAKTTSFSPFAIVGIKPAEAMVTVTVATTPAPTATPAAAMETPQPDAAASYGSLLTGTLVLLTGVVLLLGALLVKRRRMNKI